MKRIGLVALCVLAACGGKTPPPVTGSGSGSGSAVEPPKKSEADTRRDAACDTLGPKITQCALDDAKAAQASGKITKEQLDEVSKPEVLAKNTEEFLKQCKVPMTGHQIRVLEVCQKEESECGPMLSCLEHLNDKPADKGDKPAEK